ncbi:MAG TPA: 50S ribosomal protein L21 [Allosphingosinicella sp.]
MFAVVRTGGKQYRVAAGDKIAVEKIPGEAGDSVTLGDVLLAGEGGDVKAAGDLTVSAEIIAQAKGEKVIVFKKRRRHNYRRKQGHRQQYTILRITAIGDRKAEGAQKTEGGEKKAAGAKKAATAKAPAAGAGSADQLVAQDAPLKVEGAESAMVDAPAKSKSKGKAETQEPSGAVAAEPAKSEPTESELVDAPKKKSTKKAKAAKDGEDEASA